MSELLLKTPIERMSVLEVEITLGLKILEIFEKYDVILSKEGNKMDTKDGRLFYKDELIAYCGSDRKLLAILSNDGCDSIKDRHEELIGIISSISQRYQSRT